MEDDLTLLVHALPGLIWIARGDAGIEFLSQAWSEYSGLSMEELSRGWDSVVHPQDIPMVQERWPLMVACEGVFEMEVRLRRFDGDYHWFMVRSRRLPGSTPNDVRLCGINTDIDERKRSEQALRTLQSNLRQTCENIPGLVCTMSPTGDVEVFNQELLEYFGRTAEEMKGWATSDAVHADDRPAVLEAFTKAVSLGTPYDVEHRCRRFDGVYRWFQVRALAMRDANNVIAGWFVLLTDIENRKRAEDAIRASERNLNLIINTIPAMAWSASTNGAADFCNQHYLEYTGLTQEQADGVGWTSAVHAEDLPGLGSTWMSILASGKPGEAEARLRRFDGSFHWFLFRVSPLVGESGQIVKWYGINTDIDDRKRTEDELRRSERFLAEGERMNVAGSFCWSPEDGALTCSEQFRRIYELELDEPITLQRIATRVHPDDAPTRSKRLALARQGLTGEQSELRLSMADGRIKYLRASSYEVVNQNGSRERVGAIQDVTERRLSDEALGTVRSDLAHMTRVASLGALTASIAHEVNQPLAGIVTNASTCLRMLAAAPANVDGALETARRIIRDANRAADVIARLRALFERKDLSVEAVQLNEATAEVLALARSELQRGRVTLRLELAPMLPTVLGDRVQLQQVILNLLLNACAAMSGIDTDDRSRELSIRTEHEQGSRVCLAVRDVGVGLDPQSVDRLFEAFYTTKSNGMGLGLSVSRSIIERHHGTLWATPNDGPGATFSFSIPCASS